MRIRLAHHLFARCHSQSHGLHISSPQQGFW
jgi:hypothetical protein